MTAMYCPTCGDLVPVRFVGSIDDGAGIWVDEYRCLNRGHVFTHTINLESR